MSDIDTQFVHLLMQMQAGALVGLGVMENPMSKEKKKDLAQARAFIDQLEMIRKKTAGNLSPEESKMLDESLHQLRLAFVGASHEDKAVEGA